MRDPIENITLLQRQINELQIENQLLKNLLSQNGVSYEKSLLQLKTDEHVEEYELNQGKRIIHPDEITEEMANIFFSRFWGRQDVYAKRSVNKTTGKVGYYPQCENFWSNKCHIRLKTGVKCKDCDYYVYDKLTKDIIDN